jgi:hypothetical protein
MPFDDIAEVAGGVFRLLGRFLAEVLLEFVVQGAGHTLIRAVTGDEETGETAATVVGILFWVVVVAGGYYLYRVFA